MIQDIMNFYFNNHDVKFIIEEGCYNFRGYLHDYKVSPSWEQNVHYIIFTDVEGRRIALENSDIENYTIINNEILITL
jgi:hypothetical protein